MKQIYKLLLMSTLLFMASSRMSAYDIAVENSDGVKICYNYINEGKELEVTFQSSDFRAQYWNSIIDIPEYVTYMNRKRKVSSIGQSAFLRCGKLKRIIIPNSVTSIGENAFYECSGLTSVTIGNGVTSIGENAFYECSGLTSVHITDLSAWCGISFGDGTANPLSHAHHLFLNGTEIKDLVIPNGVKTIGSSAFRNCSGLTSVTIPNSVTSIGDYAFDWCSGLTSVSIPNSVTFIGGSAFAGCSSLTAVTIPNSVTFIGGSAFAGCSSLTAVPIPNSVTSIGDHAFDWCSGLTSVSIPNSVTSIGKSAFRDCSGLTMVIIGSGVTSIGSLAFDGCDILEVISYILVPFILPGNSFNQNTFYNATLYVPQGTIKKYKTTMSWNRFVFIEENDAEISVLPKTPTYNDSVVYDKFYDLSGQQITSWKGLIIRKGKKYVAKERR